MEGLEAMVFFFLMLLAGAAALYDSYSCELRSARSCGDFRPNREDVDMYRHIRAKCPRKPSVLAPTLTDVLRLPDSYLIIADMPGVSSGSLNITASSGRLSFSGLVHDPETHHRVALRGHRGPPLKLFAREFLLPEHVDASRMSHSIHNGVLRVTLPVDTRSIQHAVEDAECGGVPPARSICLCSIQQGESALEPQPLASRWSERPPNSCDDGHGEAFTMQPLTDISEDLGLFELVAEMPGARPDSIRVGLDCSSTWYDDCIVSVSGVVREEDDQLQGVQSLRIERGPSSRVFTGRFAAIPREYEGANVTYHLSQDGLLRATVHMPDAVRAELF